MLVEIPETPLSTTYSKALDSYPPITVGFALTAYFRTETLFPAPACSLDYLELEPKTGLWALTYDSIITYSIVRNSIPYLCLWRWSLERGMRLKFN